MSVYLPFVYKVLKVLLHFYYSFIENVSPSNLLIQNAILFRYENESVPS
jgi:hypothetical protein